MKSQRNIFCNHRIYPKSENKTTEGLTGTENANFRAASVVVGGYVAGAGIPPLALEVLTTAPVASKWVTKLATSLQLGRLGDSMPDSPRNRQDRDYDLASVTTSDYLDSFRW